jgi:soluble lytic murein transglycosylase-like protein
MPEEPTNFQSISAALGLITTGIALLAIMGIIISEITYLATLAHLLEAKILASTVAAAITAVSSAPQAGLYCVSIPGSFSYDVAVGFQTLAGTGGPPLRPVPSLAYCPLITPSFTSADQIPYIAEFKAAAQKYDVPVAYLLAIGWLESGLRHYQADGVTLIGNANYCGIMAVRCIPEHYDLEANIDAGAAELRRNMDTFGGDFQAALAGYSGGTYGAQLFIEALGGDAIWVENLGQAETLQLPIYAAINSGPFAGMTFPDGSAYTVEKQNACEVARGTDNALYFQGLGLGSTKYGFVAALKDDGQSGAASYFPVSDIQSQVFHLPAGDKHTLVVKKTLMPLEGGRVSERISLIIRKGGLEQAGCMEDTPSICLF